MVVFSCEANHCLSKMLFKITLCTVHFQQKKKCLKAYLLLIFRLKAIKIIPCSILGSTMPSICSQVRQQAPELCPCWNISLKHKVTLAILSLASHLLCLPLESDYAVWLWACDLHSVGKWTENLSCSHPEHLGIIILYAKCIMASTATSTAFWFMTNIRQKQKEQRNRKIRHKLRATDETMLRYDWL